MRPSSLEENMGLIQHPTVIFEPLQSQIYYQPFQQFGINHLELLQQDTKFSQVSDKTSTYLISSLFLNSQSYMCFNSFVELLCGTSLKNN